MSGRFILSFIVFLAIFAGLVWLGGFNFDQRNIHVAFGTLFSVIFSIFGALGVECFLEDI